MHKHMNVSSIIWLKNKEKKNWGKTDSILHYSSSFPFVSLFSFKLHDCKMNEDTSLIVVQLTINVLSCAASFSIFCFSSLCLFSIFMYPNLCIMCMLSRLYVPYGYYVPIPINKMCQNEKCCDKFMTAHKITCTHTHTLTAYDRSLFRFIMIFAVYFCITIEHTHILIYEFYFHCWLEFLTWKVDGCITKTESNSAMEIRGKMIYYVFFTAPEIIALEVQRFTVLTFYLYWNPNLVFLLPTLVLSSSFFYFNADVNAEQYDI